MANDNLEFMPPPIIPTDAEPATLGTEVEPAATLGNVAEPAATPGTVVEPAATLGNVAEPAATPGTNVEPAATPGNVTEPAATPATDAEPAATPGAVPTKVVGTEAHATESEEATSATSVTTAATEATTAATSTATEATKDTEATSASSEGEPHFPTADEIRQAIYDVVDPEINISIIDLGLVYDIIPKPEEGTVQINMTLTSPGCPLGPEITSAVYLKVTRMPLVKDCQVELVWTPMWDPNVNPTEETRIALGLW